MMKRGRGRFRTDRQSIFGVGATGGKGSDAGSGGSWTDAEWWAC